MKRKLSILFLVLLNLAYVYVSSVWIWLNFSLFVFAVGEEQGMIVAAQKTEEILLWLIPLSIGLFLVNYLVSRKLIVSKRPLIVSLLVTLMGVLIIAGVLLYQRQSYLEYQRKNTQGEHYFFKRVEDSAGITPDTLTLFDRSRNRTIPVAFYKPGIDHPKIVILSHGYGANKGGDYLAYSYLTEFLASKGYFVASIQHELPGDSLIPLSGIPQIVRRPFWERGADNILFVINELKKSHPGLDFKHITLIGHSNGGDMTALFPQKYPGIIDKLITFDNRRMALPRTGDPKVCSLRSSDMPADQGVLPTDEEQKKYGMTIIQLPNTLHNDMDNKANEEQRKEITNYVLAFLEE